MADDPYGKLKAELEAAKAVLEPQIRGLHKMANDQVSAGLLDEINSQIVQREQALGLINTALSLIGQINDVMDQLYAAGYPSFPQEELPPDLALELKGEVEDIKAGAGVFTTSGAVRMTISLGAPQPKD